MRPKKALIIYIEFASQPKEHQKTVRVVKETLKEHGCDYRFIPRNRFNKRRMRGADIIITVGGDGTFLSVAQQNVKGVPMLGVNSNPQTKVGFLCNADRFDFKKKFERISKNRFRLVKLTRLECKIGQKVLEPALNEIFFGHSKPYKLSRYTLYINKKSEKQRSSGIIVGTATGSNAWLRSAGAKPMRRDATRMQLFVREPHKGPFMRSTMVKTLLRPNDVIRIKSREKNQIVIADSVGVEYKARYGEWITIRRSPHPLPVIFF
ncbi:MAG: hypothetical protein GXP63_05670 [DPANN group archaeon]|nr:hypothetical protein [DPANN group archaeon]